MNIKRNIRIMYIIALLQGMVFYAPIVTLYRQAKGVTIFQISLIESIFFVLCILLEVPWGIVADKIGYRKTMIFCCVLYFISKVAFWKADGFFGFLVERIMLGIVFSGLSGVDISILYLSTDEDNSQRVFSIYNNLGTAGLIISSVIYSFIAKENYSLAGLLTVITYGISAILSFGLKEVKQIQKEEDDIFKDFKDIIKQLLKNKAILIFLISVTLFNEVHQAITVFLNQLQYVKCGLSNAAIAYIYIIVTICGLLGGFSAFLTKRLGKKSLGKILLISSIVACFMLMLTNNAYVSILAIIILRISSSIFQPLQQQIQNELICSKNRATALSLNAIIMESVAIFINIMFGKAADINLSYAMFLGMIFSLIACVLFACSTRKFNIKR